VSLLLTPPLGTGLALCAAGRLVQCGHVSLRQRSFTLGLGTNTMRSSRVLTLVAGAALLAACGGGDSTGPSNNVAPTADFTYECSDLACTFTDRSTDTDGQITSQTWAFGDGATGTGLSPSHTYAQGGTFSVTVTAKDNGGKSTTSAPKVVTVTAPSAGGPTAAFTVTCSSLDCTVTNTSTATGSVVTWDWDFGDGSQTSTDQNPAPVHYNVTTPSTFTITLVVTSDGLTSQATKQVTVAPPADLTCSGGQACTLLLPQRSTVVVTLESSDCAVHGNTFVLTAPVNEVLFDDGCYAPTAPDPAATHPLNGGAAFDAGTELQAQVTSGFPGTTNAQLQVTGDYASGWTLKYDDGYVGPDEPDFNDLIITIKATPAP
jgi:PKD repeat protein